VTSTGNESNNNSEMPTKLNTAIISQEGGPVHSCLSVPPAVKTVKKVLTSEVQQYIYIYIYIYILGQFEMRSELYSVLSEI